MAAACLALGWAVVYLPPALSMTLVLSGLATAFWLQAPMLALYGLLACSPFTLGFTIGSNVDIRMQDVLLLFSMVFALQRSLTLSRLRARLQLRTAELIVVLWTFLLVWGAITFLLGPANRWLLRDALHNAWYVYADIGRTLLIFPLMFACLEDRRSVERILDLLVLVGTGVALNAIWQTLGTSDNATGHFETNNALAGYLVLVIPFAAARLFMHDSGLIRALHAVALVILFRALWLAGSRGGLVAFLSSLLVLAVLVPRRRVVAAGLAALIGLVVLGATRGDLLDRPMVRRFITITRYQDVETFQWRQEQWEIFIQRIRQRPWLGSGSEVDESLRDLDRARTAHNAFLALSVKSGIPAAIAWVLILVSMGALVARRAIASIAPRDRVFWTGSLAFLVALIVHNMVESTLITVVTQHVFWTVTACALLLACAREGQADAPERAASPAAPREGALRS